MVLVLQYADDTLVLLKTDKINAENLRYILMWFEATSGLHVNTTNTKLFRLNEVEE